MTWKDRWPILLIALTLLVMSLTSGCVSGRVVTGVCPPYPDPSLAVIEVLPDDGDDGPVTGWLNQLETLREQLERCRGEL